MLLMASAIAAIASAPFHGLLAWAVIPVMVSSHSPYFIQGIRYFAHQEQIEELVKYYLTENDETSDLSTVEDVTTNLNMIFKKLSEPLNHIMNLK